MMKVVLSGFGFLLGVAAAFAGGFFALWGAAVADTRRLAGNEMMTGLEGLAVGGVILSIIVAICVVVLGIAVCAELFDDWKRGRR